MTWEGRPGPPRVTPIFAFLFILVCDQACVMLFNSNNKTMQSHISVFGRERAPGGLSYLAHDVLASQPPTEAFCMFPRAVIMVTSLQGLAALLNASKVPLPNPQLDLLWFCTKPCYKASNCLKDRQLSRLGWILIIAGSSLLLALPSSQAGNTGILCLICVGFCSLGFPCFLTKDKAT